MSVKVVDAGQKVNLTGGCQCGAVRYALHAQPEASICHCRMCQKAVGGPFAALASVAAAHLTWTRGAPATFASSSVAERGFCAVCGTPLTYSGVDRQKVDVTIASLDTPEVAPPLEQFGIEGRLSWFAALPGLPAHPTEEKYAGLTSFQHPDHDT